ncbi:hypothetical protein MMC20_002748 [Loxospora ochrophaea]|nr:hypothetical protein [Loxospora ochrophaea]
MYNFSLPKPNTSQPRQDAQNGNVSFAATPPAAPYRHIPIHAATDAMAGAPAAWNSNDSDAIKAIYIQKRGSQIIQVSAQGHSYNDRRASSYTYNHKRANSYGYNDANQASSYSYKSKRMSTYSCNDSHLAVPHYRSSVYNSLAYNHRDQFPSPTELLLSRLPFAVPKIQAPAPAPAVEAPVWTANHLSPMHINHHHSDMSLPLPYDGPIDYAAPSQHITTPSTTPPTIAPTHPIQPPVQRYRAHFPPPAPAPAPAPAPPAPKKKRRSLFSRLSRAFTSRNEVSF